MCNELSRYLDVQDWCQVWRPISHENEDWISSRKEGAKIKTKQGLIRDYCDAII